MEKLSLRQPAAVGLVALLAIVVGTNGSLAQEVKAPEPGVPEIFTLEGQFVRIAYNNEGYVSLGYRVANQSAGALHHRFLPGDHGFDDLREVISELVEKRQLVLVLRPADETA